MSIPIPLQDRFVRMWRDNSRDQLPPGSVWNLEDYIPDELGAPLRKRGGWSYHGSALTSLDASAGVPARVFVAPFSGGTQVLAVDDRATPELFDLTNGVDRGAVGSALANIIGPPVFYREMAIFPRANLLSTPQAPQKYVAAGTISDLGGSPPGARFLSVYKDRLIIASADTDTPNRIFFSAAGNAESWDTTNRYLDVSHPPVALAALRNSLLVFHSGSVERIRGSIPPGSAAANMEFEPLFDDVGLFEYDALAIAGDLVYWADENGVYRTDGSSAPVDLTKQGGMSSYWRSLVSSVGISGSIALAAYRGFLFISLQSSSDTFVDFLVYDIDDRSWFRFKNIRAYNFAVQYGATDELYFSNRDTSSKRIGKLSSVFDPSSSVKNDADGDAVTPVLETGLYPLRDDSKKRWKHVYLSHDTRDAASDNPIQTISYLTSPEATSYTALSPAFTETTERETQRRSISSVPVYAMGFKVAQSNASSDTRIYGLKADIHGLEGSRR